METLAGVATVVVTVSDSKSNNISEDQSGPEAVRILEEMGAQVVTTLVIPDEESAIVDAIIEHCDDENVRLLVTTGGTGVGPRDVTPDVTARLCDRLIPGIPEVMRRVSLKKTPHAALSRAIAGVRGNALLINLPGSPGGVRDCLHAVRDILPHAIALVGDETTRHMQT